MNKMQGLLANEEDIIEESFATHDEALRGVSLVIHDLKELAFEEYKSSELIANFLECEDFTVERRIAGDPTAFVATWTQGQGPVVSFNAVWFQVRLNTNVRNTTHFLVLDMRADITWLPLLALVPLLQCNGGSKPILAGPGLWSYSGHQHGIHRYSD